VFALLQTLRERSIQARSADLKMPDLNDPQLILKGAGQYAAMCTQCHLTPAMKDSELRPGLYPQPPNLSQARSTRRRHLGDQARYQDERDARMGSQP